MKTQENEIRVYYDRNSDQAKKVLAYARTITRHVHEVEVDKTPFTPTMWKQLLEMLDMKPKNLMNKAHPYYQMNVKGRDFDEEGWLNVLIRNPELLIAPIVVKGNRAMLCSNPTDMLGM